LHRRKIFRFMFKILLKHESENFPPVQTWLLSNLAAPTLRPLYIFPFKCRGGSLHYSVQDVPVRCVYSAQFGSNQQELMGE
jgi:hypothetical protein